MLALVSQAADDGQAQLARAVRAVLTDRCFACHGPDSASREADLRLDLREAFIVESMTDSDRHIVTPGDADASELWHRIATDDNDLRMPPAYAKLSITDEEQQLIKRWIEADAPWVGHWAFDPPAKADLPTPAFDDWGRNEIDRFIAARLEQEGLRPAARADRESLIRRVTIDLTGMPPTLELVDSFLSDSSPEAYEKVIDRLLQSPRFGEHWATPWLDAARYADTYGYQADRYRAMWRWRDWVVEALNENIPYDKFLTYQLAGDLVPNANHETILATAYGRLHRQTNEGGSIPEEWRAEYVADRTNTLGAAVLGLTLECARCHDHKFDPISQRDYYKLSAYFNNLDELGLYSHFTDGVPTPTLWLTTGEQKERIERLRSEIEELEMKGKQLVHQHQEDFERWYAKYQQEEHEPLEMPTPLVHVEFEEGRGEVPGVVGRAQQLDGEKGTAMKSVGSFTRDEPFTLAIWVKPTKEAERAVLVHRTRAWLDAAGRGYQLILEECRPSAALVHFWPGNAIAIRAKQPLPVGQWSHLTMTYDGSSRAEGLRLYVNGEQVPTEIVRDSLTRTIRYVAGDLERDSNVSLSVGHRFRDNGFAQGVVDEFYVFGHRLTRLEILRLPGLADLADDNSVSKEQLLDFYISRLCEPHLESQQRLAERRKELSAAIAKVEEIMVMREMPEQRPTFVLERGAYDAPGEQVDPTTPESIGGEIQVDRADRLGLARWITDDENPLAARVAVNRYWHGIFGRGLVATLSDFGSQGAAPTHPELLDWLARQFVESGWDSKALIKLIVMSETYQQSSVVSLKKRAADPENLLLARGGTLRHPPEVLRDSALAASGLLVEQVGGPPVKPFQPAGLWKEKGAASYQRQKGSGSHRRSLYTIWKRTSPPPAMMVFDAADREVCTMQRQTTATPLQSLVMLNDPQFVEAARGLADKAYIASPETPDRVSYVFRSLTARFPTTEEQQVLQQLYADQKAIFSANGEDAKRHLETGDHRPASTAPPEELAALSMVALAVMSLDAFLLEN